MLEQPILFNQIRGGGENCVFFYTMQMCSLLGNIGIYDKVYGTSSTYISQTIPEVH